MDEILRGPRQNANRPRNSRDENQHSQASANSQDLARPPIANPRKTSRPASPANTEHYQGAQRTTGYQGRNFIEGFTDLRRNSVATVAQVGGSINPNYKGNLSNYKDDFNRKKRDDLPSPASSASPASARLDNETWREKKKAATWVNPNLPQRSNTPSPRDQTMLGGMAAYVTTHRMVYCSPY